MLAGLSAAELSRYNWPFWARPAQLWPGDEPEPWNVWLVLAGRGFGKSRCGAEAVRAAVRSGRYGRLALVAPTAADARDVMVEGESGILAVHPDAERPTYEPSKRRLTWPNGAVGTLFSAEEPERLRGPQHDLAWCDELAAWARLVDTWDMLQFGLRLGQDPRAIVTTTPKPVKLLREWVKTAGPDGRGGGVHVTRGSTYDNAGNLAAPFLRKIRERYEGTALGRQELHAALLDEAPGALWTRALIEQSQGVALAELTRVVVGVDPSVAAGGTGDLCGIVGVGRDAAGRVAVLRDASLNAGPRAWATAAVRLYHRLGANAIVAEGNQGGELVREVLRSVDPGVPVQIVHASHGKAARAEPVVALYEQGRVTHAQGADLGALEDELVSWVPGTGASPGRLDALVWAVTTLAVRGGGEAGVEVF